jgi:hypothetical protein
LGHHILGKEGSNLSAYVEEYRTRFCFYPSKILADMLYCSRENRKWLKTKGIKKMEVQPLRRPSSKAVENHVSPRERNPLEGKFGQAKKNGYGMNRIRARLKKHQPVVYRLHRLSAQPVQIG